MKAKNLQGRIALLLVAAIFFANPSFAQSQASPPQEPSPVSSQVNSPRPQGSPAKRDEATLDTLFAADSYKLYGEVRMVGQLVRSPGVAEILEPILNLSSPPDDFKTLIRFLNTNADALATSRILFAAMPARSGLPQTIAAIELPSAEEAQKFEPKLQKLLPVLFPTPSPTPTPTPSPTSSSKPIATSLPAPSPTPANSSSPNKSDENQSTVMADPVLMRPGQPGAAAVAVIDEKKGPEGPPFLIRRSGSLVLISDIPFTFRNLRPAGSKLLSEDQNFRVARDRFSSEPLFLYYNLGLEDRNKSQQVAVATSDGATLHVEEMPQTSREETTVESKPETNPEAQPASPDASPSPDSSPSNEDPAVMPPRDSVAQLSAVAVPAQPEPTPDPTDPFLSSLFGAFGVSEPEWPEALGVALSFESDSYIVRMILIDPPDKKTTPIPFLPQLISGRALAAEAPSVLPADTEFFVSASLDLPRMYAALLQNLQKMNTVQTGYSRSQPGEKPVESTDTAATERAFEKKYGFKIKEELLPALGNEVAVGGTLQSLGLAGAFGMASPPPQATPSPSPPGSSQLGQGQAPGITGGQAPTSPVFLISVRDREAVKGLIPRLLDAMGMKALSLVAQTEKRDDTETVTYAGVLSYAFVDKFLVLSPDVAAIRHVVDSYVAHETLGSNSAFRTFTRWQPREIQAQAYVAPSVIAGYREAFRNPALQIDVAMREFLAKLNPAPEAVTYALSHDGFGPIHELRLPRNLVLMSVAGISAGTKQSPVDQNEAIARYELRAVVSAEAIYLETAGKGSYGSLDQLVAEKLIQKEMLENHGYKIELIVAGAKFEATATPKEYGTTGRLSFFVDESGLIRGGDHNGASANAGDRPASELN
ncbi:MAG: hypothetical protein ABJC05_06045 [Pyrinomonadaceae bacterium]